MLEAFVAGGEFDACLLVGHQTCQEGEEFVYVHDGHLKDFRRNLR